MTATFPRRFIGIYFLLLLAMAGLLPGTIQAQSVCLPAPRLLTTMPMGGQQGTTFELTITGQNLEQAGDLLFSHPGITVAQKKDTNGEPIANQYTITISADCPTGIHEARVTTRLGISSARAFNVGQLSETLQQGTVTALESAMPLQINALCNAKMTTRAVDHYSFEARQGQRILVDCAAQGIDSKLMPVVIIADAQGQDLLVERRGGPLDFSVPADGKYIIKVHDLTYNGGPYYFYRLALKELAAGEPIIRQASTQKVSSFSWPPALLDDQQFLSEAEPNNEQAQQVTLPCQVSGQFFPAADVDYYEFQAKKGEVWWIEVASERLGLPTDPSLVVQQVKHVDGEETLNDFLELTDIPSPVKISSNGYSYDGPPYNAGSTDILGKMEIKEDGTYRLRITDLFGGTRSDPNNRYQLIIRQAQPDFALVGWAMHMGLRNGDRNALSKPIALRRGATMPIEVVALRRDGFNGEIKLTMENLPAGVTATGLTIPAGKSSSVILITASADAPEGYANAKFQGQAVIADQSVTRPCRLASMVWPVTNAWSEIPKPRLIGDVPVSVCDDEGFPISIAAVEEKLWEATEGEKLTIPLVHQRRCDFSGTKISLKTFGAGFEKVPAFDAPLDNDASEAVLDLAALKTKPGDYTIAFYGSAVAKYSYCPEMAKEAETNVNHLNEQLAAVEADLKTLQQELVAAVETAKSELEQRIEKLKQQQSTLKQELATAEKVLKQATARAKPKDIVDIIVSQPIRIRVHPAKEIVQK